MINFSDMKLVYPLGNLISKSDMYAKSRLNKALLQLCVHTYMELLVT